MPEANYLPGPDDIYVSPQQAQCLDMLIQARRATASISRALAVEDNPELGT
jgi:hypothetical protein